MMVVNVPEGAWSVRHGTNFSEQVPRGDCVCHCLEGIFLVSGPHHTSRTVTAPLSLCKVSCFSVPFGFVLVRGHKTTNLHVLNTTAIC